MDDIEQFRWRLAETIAWCNRTEAHRLLSDPERAFRSEALRPASTFWYLARDKWPPTAEHLRSRKAAIDTLAETRRNLLTAGWEARNAPASRRPAADLAGGRLLLYRPDENLQDGAAALASERFLNDDNEPPWDTWIAYVAHAELRGNEAPSSYLLSWAPPIFLNLAAAGVRVNPEECIVWADTEDTPFTRQLRAAGLL